MGVRLDAPDRAVFSLLTFQFVSVKGFAASSAFRTICVDDDSLRSDDALKKKVA